LGTYRLPRAGIDSLSLYPDSYWLVAGGDSAGGADSSLFLVRLNGRDNIGTLKLDIKLLNGNGSGANFGYTLTTLTDAQGDYQVANIWLVAQQNIGTVTVTDIGSGQSNVLADDVLTIVQPTGFVAVNGPFVYYVDSNALTASTATETTRAQTVEASLQSQITTLTNTVTQMQTDVAAAFDSLTAAFQALQTSLGA
jgi:hypothetical protein